MNITLPQEPSTITPSTNPQAPAIEPAKRNELELPWEQFAIDYPTTAEFVQKELQAQEMARAIAVLEFESLNELFPVLGQKGKLDVTHNGNPMVSIRVGVNIAQKPSTPQGINEMAEAYRAVANLTAKALEEGVMQVTSNNDFSINFTRNGAPLPKFKKPDTDTWKNSLTPGSSLNLELEDVRKQFPNTFKLIYCKTQKNHLELKLGTDNERRSYPLSFAHGKLKDAIGQLRSKVVEELHTKTPKNTNLRTRVNGYADVTVTPFQAVGYTFPDTPEWKAKLKEAKEAPGKTLEKLKSTGETQPKHTFYVTITSTKP
jgi:hypothetical protein